jgi:hypothetical protein
VNGTEIIQQPAVLTAFPYVTHRGVLPVFQNFAILTEFVFTVAERVVYIHSKPDTFTSSSYVNTLSELFQSCQTLAT